jgi:DNA-binding YbaB/EbfC family protein
MSDFNPGSMPGLGGLADMLGGFQQKLEQLKEEAANTEATGAAGGGAVTVVATSSTVLSVSISDAAMEDKELLEDLVRAATNDAIRKAQEASAGKLNELVGSLPIPPGILPGT